MQKPFYIEIRPIPSVLPSLSAWNVAVFVCASVRAILFIFHLPLLWAGWNHESCAHAQIIEYGGRVQTTTRSKAHMRAVVKSCFSDQAVQCIRDHART